MTKALIPTTERRTCPVCGNTGTLCQNLLTDRMFGAPGSWTLKRCSVAHCRTHWLDPAPQPEYLYRLYQEYSTHTSAMVSTFKVDTIARRIQASYLQHKYGYDTGLPGLWLKLWWLAYVYPGWKDMQDTRTFYLPHRTNGRFLDVGCGNGNAMLTMLELGWEVYGIDTDEHAVTFGRSLGLEIERGTLDSVHYADSSFDAILLTNVIEHVSDPREVLMECFRILRPGGKITLITPNVGGFGFRLFGKNWRGLETPQHLQLFTKHSLANLCQQVKFNDAKAFTSPHSDFYIFEQSLSLMRRTGSISHETKPSTTILSKLLRRIFSIVTGYLNFIFDRSEAIIVTATKPLI